MKSTKFTLLIIVLLFFHPFGRAAGLSWSKHANLILKSSNIPSAGKGIESIADQTVCSTSAQMTNVSGFYPTGTWAKYSGSGTLVTPTLLTTAITNLGSGANIFVWTPNNQGAPSNVTITNSSINYSAGTNQTVLTNSASLKAELGAGAVGVWSAVSQSIQFLSPNSPTSNVTGLEYGPNVLTWYVSNNSCQNSSSVIITYQPDFDISTGSSTKVCPNQLIKFGVSYGYDDLYWTINSKPFNGSNNASTAYSFPNEGVDTIALHVTIKGIPFVVKKLITVSGNTSPNVKIGASNTNVCANDPIKLTATNTLKQYDWYDDNGSLGNSASISASFSSIGSHKIRLIGTNECNLSSIDSIIINVSNALPVDTSKVSITPTGACPNTLINFQTNASGNILWELGDGTSSSKANFTSSYGTVGYYNVKLSIINGCGNNATLTRVVPIALNETKSTPVNVIVDELYQNGSTVASPIIPKQTLHFSTGTNNPNLKANWNFGDGSSSTLLSPTHQYAKSGTYTIQLSVVNECNVTSTASLTINVDGTFKPFAALTAFPKVICPGEYVYFYDNNHENSNLTYGIIFGDGTSDNNPAININDSLQVLAKHQYSQTGSYIYTFTAKNEAGNTVSIKDTIFVSSDSNKKTSFYIGNTTDRDDHIAAQITYTYKVSNSKSYYLSFNGLENGELDNSKSKGTFELGTYGENQLDKQIVSVGTFSLNGDSTMTLYNGGNSICSTTSICKYSVKNRMLTFKQIKSGNCTARDTLLIVNNANNVNTIIFRGATPSEERNMVKYGNYTVGQGISQIVYVPSSSQTGRYYMYKTDVNGAQTNYISSGDYTVSGLNIAYNDQFNYCPNNTSVFSIKTSGSNVTYTDVLQGQSCTAIINFLQSKTFSKSTDGKYDIYAYRSADTTKYVALRWSDNRFKFGFVKDNKPFTTISAGVFTVNQDQSISIKTNLATGCQTIANYNYQMLSNDGIRFTAKSESCTDRLNFLSGFYFKKYNDPLADSTSTRKVLCPNDKAILQIAGGQSYKWVYNNTVFSTSQNAKISFPTDGNYDVMAIAKNACGKTDTLHTLVVVNSDYVPSNFTITSNTNLASTQDTVIFSANGANQSDGIFDSNQYTWNFGDGNSSKLKQPQHVFTKEGEYNIKLTVTNGCGSNDFYYFVKVTKAAKALEAKFSYTINGLKVSFTNLSSGNPDKLLWNFTDTAKDSIQSPVYTFASPGIYDVILTAYNTKTGYMDKLVQSIKVGTATQLIADFKYNATEGSNNVLFYNESFGTPLKYLWDFGDETYSNKASASHLYADAGEYEVCFYVSDSTKKLADGICKTVIVGTPTNQADYAFYAETKSTVVFKDNSSGAIDKWFWDFGDNSYSNITNPKHTYTQSGLYNVCLTTLDNTTKYKSQDCQNVLIQIGTDQSLFAKFSLIKKQGSDTIYFKNESTGKFTDLLWTFGDGTEDTTAITSHLYTTANTYNVCLHVYNSTTDEYDEHCQDVDFTNKQVFLNANYSFFVDNDNLMVNFSDESKGTPSKWYWNFGDGTIDTQAKTSHTYSKPGIYNVCLQVQDSINKLIKNKCQDVAVSGKGSITRPAYSYIVNKTDAKTISFFNKSTGDSKSYYWSFGDGNYDIVESPVHKYEKSGEYNACLKVKDSKGVVSEYCKEINIADPNEPITANFDFVVDPIHLKVSVSDKSQGGADSWRWDFGDGAIMSGNTTSHTYTNAGVFQVCLSSTNSTTGKFGSICKSVQVNNQDKPIINPKFSYFVNTIDNSVSFNDLSTGRVNKWYWTFDNTQASGEKNPVVKLAKEGKYNVCLHVQDSISKVVAEHCEEILVLYDSKTPFISAGFTYYTEPSKTSVSFKNDSKGKPAKWNWTFGDGTYGEGETLTHTFKTSGNYDVCLNVADANGTKSDRVCKSISVGNATCTVEANFSYLIDDLTNSVSFTNSSKGNVNKCFWEFGDGGSSTQWNTTYKYNEGDSYKVTMSVSDASKACIDHHTAIIQVGTAPCYADFDYDTDVTNKGVSFADASDGNIKSRSWDFGDGTYSNETNPKHTYSSNGQFDVTLSIKTTDGCIDKIEQEIQVGNINCNADFTYYVDSASNATKFNPISVGNTSTYYWDFGDGSNSNLAQSSHSFANPGFYTVSLTTKSADGQCMDYKEDFILISKRNGSVLANFDYNIGSDGKTVVYANKSIGENPVYIWNFGDQTQSTQKTPEPHVYAKDGFYNVCLTAYVSKTKRATICKDIRVAKTDTAVIRSQFYFDVDLPNFKANFVSTSIGNPSTYLWDFGDGQSSSDKNPVHVYAKAGQYLVTLKVNNAAGNAENYSAQVVNMTDKDDFAGLFKLFVKPTTNKTQGYPVDIMGAAHGKPALKVWDFGDGTKDSTSTTPNHVYAKPGTYTVSFTVTDPVTGKTSTSTQTIVITATPEDIKLDAEILAYPNPSKGAFTLNVVGTDAADYYIDVINTQSQILYNTEEKRTVSFTKEMNVNLSPGVYQLRVRSLNRIKVIKLVIE